HVQPVDLRADRRHAPGHVELPIGPCRGAEGSGQHCESGREGAYFSVHTQDFSSSNESMAGARDSSKTARRTGLRISRIANARRTRVAKRTGLTSRPCVESWARSPRPTLATARAGARAARPGPTHARGSALS